MKVLKIEDTKIPFYSFSLPELIENYVGFYFSMCDDDTSKSETNSRKT